MEFQDKSGTSKQVNLQKSHQSIDEHKISMSPETKDLKKSDFKTVLEKLLELLKEKMNKDDKENVKDNKFSPKNINILKQKENEQLKEIYHSDSLNQIENCRIKNACCVLQKEKINVDNFEYIRDIEIKEPNLDSVKNEQTKDTKMINEDKIFLTDSSIECEKMHKICEEESVKSLRLTNYSFKDLNMPEKKWKIAENIESQETFEPFSEEDYINQGLKKINAFYKTIQIMDNMFITDKRGKSTSFPVNFEQEYFLPLKDKYKHHDYQYEDIKFDNKETLKMAKTKRIKKKRQKCNVSILDLFNCFHFFDLKNSLIPCLYCSKLFTSNGLGGHMSKCSTNMPRSFGLRKMISNTLKIRKMKRDIFNNKTC